MPHEAIGSPHPRRWSRRSFLALTAGSAALLAAGCAKDAPGTVADDGSVTVRHAFGETRIPKPPQRVVSAGLTDQDDLLALGVVPIAVTEWFGGEPFATWSWARPKLGPAQPVVLTLAEGVPTDQIAGLRPDLIVATNAGLDADTYAALSKIAPTIAQSGPDAFFEPWKDQAEIIGQAVFKADEMRSLVTAVDDRFTQIAKDEPAFGGKKVYLVAGTLDRDRAVVTPAGPRTEFLTQMGLVVPEGIGRYVDGDSAFVPRDRMAAVLDEADVVIWTTENDAESGALLADPTVAALRSTTRNRAVFTDRDLAGAIAFGTVLSYPVVADRLPPLLSRALA